MQTATALEQRQLVETDARLVEQRRVSRTITIYRVARLITNRDSGLCRIHNISDFGAMLLTSLAADPGDMVTISLSDSVHLSGEVRWREGARMGIEFSTAIDAVAILKALSAARQRGDERPTRLPTNVIATAVTPYRTSAVTVRNISQQGMQVAHDGSFTIGLPVKVVLENGLARRGIVKWSSGDVAGLRLLEPISYRDLESVSRL